MSIVRATPKRPRRCVSSPICSTARSAAQPENSSCRRSRAVGRHPLSFVRFGDGWRVGSPPIGALGSEGTLAVVSALAANPAVRAVGIALMWFVLQGVVAGAVVGVLLMALRQASASLRYLVACAGLGAMAVMPVATAARHWTSPPVTAVVEATPSASAGAATTS